VGMRVAVAGVTAVAGVVVVVARVVDEGAPARDVLDDHSGCETGGYAQIGFGFYRRTVYTYACFCGCWRLARMNE
jgi:hypothetical protein